VGADGRTLVKDRPLLSIKDLDLSDEIEALADAGARAFKIEGRLKDADYVKNVTCHLRRRLDALLERRPELGRASSGRATRGFEPCPAKTFQRGRAGYRLDGARRPMGTGPSSGHLGEPIGRVASVSGAHLLLDRDHDLSPGDGLAFPGQGGRVAGTLVNAADGRRIEVQSPAGIRAGQDIYRSFDHAWHKMLRGAAVERRIGVEAGLDFPDDCARLGLRDEDGCCAEAVSTEAFGPPKDAGRFAQVAGDALSRLGDTPFRLDECTVDPAGFLPLGRLNGLRRRAAEILAQKRIDSHPRQARRKPAPSTAALPHARPTHEGEEGPAEGSFPLPHARLGYEWNVSNSLARAFYARRGVVGIEPALEVTFAPGPRPIVMTTRLCIKYELGWCPRHKNEAPAKKMADPGYPLYLVNGQTTLMCEFDCEACVMRLILGARD
jgi:putative protease